MTDQQATPDPVEIQAAPTNEAEKGITGNETTGPESRGTVVLLHGLGVGSWLLSLLAQRLRSEGYHTENWGYYSLWQSLENLIPDFESRFDELQKRLPPETPLYIVCHSMGAIITRAVLSKRTIPHLRRVVMLSPPHRGSHFATLVGPYLKWITNLVDELSDREDSLVNQLPCDLPPGLQVGIIAAEWDYVLTDLTTHLECEVDHITVPSRHSGLVLRRSAAKQILHFLEHGRFLRPATSEVKEDPATSSVDATIVEKSS
ncbi:MAG TPA: alpha/beta fold hydrolase [Planctomicrobium sp.]|nr:alpha/beta fold hydrolase [Planctomicrobium sp.]